MEQPNLTYIEQLAGGDKAFEAKFIAILKEEFPTEKTEYQNALNEGRLGDTALLVHKIKHKLNILGLEKGYGIAVKYEEELLGGKSTRSKPFMDILQNIENYLNTI